MKLALNVTKGWERVWWKEVGKPFCIGDYVEFSWLTHWLPVSYRAVPWGRAVQAARSNSERAGDTGIPDTETESEAKSLGHCGRGMEMGWERGVCAGASYMLAGQHTGHWSSAAS